MSQATVNVDYGEVFMPNGEDMECFYFSLWADAVSPDGKPIVTEVLLQFRTLKSLKAFLRKQDLEATYTEEALLQIRKKNYEK